MAAPLPQGMGIVGCPPPACLGLQARDSQTHLHFSLSVPIRGEEVSEPFSPLSLSLPAETAARKGEPAALAFRVSHHLSRAGPLPSCSRVPSGPRPWPWAEAAVSPLSSGLAPFLGRQGRGVRLSVWGQKWALRMRALLPHLCCGKLVGLQRRTSSGGHGTRLPVTKRVTGTKPRLFSPSAKLGLTLFTLMSPNLLLFQRGSQLPSPGVFGRWGFLLVRREGGPEACQCRSEPRRHPTT